MALITEAELELERHAQIIANDAPMSYHADSCPYLISSRRRNCRCNCFSFALAKLQREQKLQAE